MSDSNARTVPTAKRQKMAAGAAAGKVIRKIISTARAPSAIGPYNQAVQVNETLYISGQIGLNPEVITQ
ncbi:2-iminobutanoate/2-iminopropanoate deaminase [Geodia barretti]|uniref:2-iminobutanoate/2-iminopropanoate deaminase n=1 Tax=Geodia barretti TaxID=519541 RepID=A0AA35TJ30_GEOBA|nr:2-iminobutanoate/2-iminopropanoate deaminase [Geodia barretti]